MPTYKDYKAALDKLEAERKRGVPESVLSQARADLDRQYSQFQLDDRYSQLTNPKSQVYQGFQKELSQTLNENTPTVNSLLGLSMAMGGDYKGSSVVANEQMNAIQRSNTDAVRKGTQSYFNQNQGQADSVLGMGTQNRQFYASLDEQKRQYDEQNNFGNQLFGGLLQIGSGLLGSYLGGLGGGGAGQAKKVGSNIAQKSYDDIYFPYGRG